MTRLPSEGERSALVGFAGQFQLAARIVIAKLGTLEWIHVADPAAGIADDFQFKSGERRHALQVKWSQLPGMFTWSDLTAGEKDEPGLWAKLAGAWSRLRGASTEPLTIYLCTNNHASTTAAKGTTPLATSAADKPRSLAAFLARAFIPVREMVVSGARAWSDLAALPEVVQWEPVWTRLRQLSGLSDHDFVLFVRDLELMFGLQPSSPLLRPDEAPDDREVDHLAQTLQNIVTDPSRKGRLSRDELLSKLDWVDRLRYRHPHRFPVPMAYVSNEAAREALESAASNLIGGYLALVGPAGSGKSTLLTTINFPGHLVHYYAFVPDAPDPLSGRGEADSFFHDLSLALEDTGLRRSGVGTDLRSRQRVLLDMLDQAGVRWEEDNEATVIVIDGLDHIPREQRPTRSLLEELPAPAALPHGVFVVLGTQTLSVVPSPIQATLASEGRTIELPPLTKQEVEQLAEAAGLTEWLYPGHIKKLAEASEGHPLALTYVLEELKALEERELDARVRQELASRLLTDASTYGRDIEQRYRGYLRAVGDEAALADLLGVVARLRVPVNVRWLATWADPHALDEFVQRTAPFFHRHGPEWQFIHNSFRRFLADATARVGGEVNAGRDAMLHRKLANLCLGSTDEWLVYRDEEIAHQFLAGEHARVLELATPERLRHSLLDLRPTATVRDHALLALRSATEAGDVPSYLRMLLFRNELWARDLVLEPDNLALAVHRLDPALAVEHVARGGKLRVKAGTALKLAATYAAGDEIDAVQRILRACGGLAGLVARDVPDGEIVADWAEVVWHLSGTEEVLTQLDRHLPLPQGELPTIPSAGDPGWERVRELRRELESMQSARYCRRMAHARCFDLSLDLRDDETLDALTAVIDAESPTSWRASARYLRAQAAAQDHSFAEMRRWVSELIELDAPVDAQELEEDEDVASQDLNRHAVPLDIRIAAAELLVSAGMVDAPEIDALVPPGTVASWPDIAMSNDDGLQQFGVLIALRRLREARPDPTQEDPDAFHSRRTRADDAGTTRFRQALAVLAKLEGQLRLSAAGLCEPPKVTANADSIVRLVEVPFHVSRDWSGWYVVGSAALGMYQRLVRLAVGAGGDELGMLLGRFEAAWSSSERARYWSPERRQTVLSSVIAASPAMTGWAIEQLDLLEEDLDERAGDPHERVKLWLAQAKAWRRAGDLDRARQSLKKAVRASAAIGASDKDLQLAEWVDWLAAAYRAGQIPADTLADQVARYSSRVQQAAGVASGQAQEAAEKLTSLAFAYDAELACAAGEWLCDKEVLPGSDLVQTLVLAACVHPEIPVGVGAAAAAHLLYPLVLEPTSKIEDAVVARHERDTDGPTELLIRARTLWSVREPSGSLETPEASFQELPEASGPQTIEAVLSAMRRAATIEDCPPGGWDEVVRHAAPPTVVGAKARALLEQATRLRLTGQALGDLAALAARSGEAERAAAALSDALSRLPGYGWMRYYDGGSRLKIFDAALADRHPILVRLAREDLSTCLATGALAGNLEPQGLKRIIELVGGPDAVAGSWPDVENYLDQIAPAASPTAAETFESSAVQAGPLMAFTRWCTRYLGHPTRMLDFGSRRTLQVILDHDPAIGQAVLAEAISVGGWTAEAALSTLVNAPEATSDLRLAPKLVAELEATAVGPDAILRDLARRFASRYDMQLPRPVPRPLAAGYGLITPPLQDVSPPELDRHGVPHLDLNDPQQMVAPYYEMLELLAAAAGLGESAVMHRAAALANAVEGRWTIGGHRAQANLLTTRGERHGYRPWAYMVGRRAMGLVLAELLDASELGDPPPYPAYSLGLIDVALHSIAPEPVLESTPRPWRPEGTSTHSVGGWCDETLAAAEVYRNAYAQEQPFVLAEEAEWRSLEWSTPGETRRLETMLAPPLTAGLVLDRRRAWEAAWSLANKYPRLDLPRSHGELVVHGHEQWTDPEWYTWLALHPAVGGELGWRPDPLELFAWVGEDGAWRARSVLRVHGALSHQPPATVACGEIWQVVLSEIGLEELATAYPSLRRRLKVKRELSGSSRSGRPAQSAEEVVELPDVATS